VIVNGEGPSSGSVDSQSALLAALDEGALIGVLDERLAFVHANARLCGMSGYECANLAGQPWTILLCEPLSEFEADCVQQRLASGKIWTGEMCCRSKSGFTFWLESRLIPMNRGPVTGYALFGADITERKRVEQTLSDRERLWNMLMRSVAAGIFQTDTNGTCDFVNETWLAYTGAVAGDPQRVSWMERVHPDDVAEVGARWREAARAGGGFECEMRLLRPDGSSLWVTCSVCEVRNESGERAGFLGVAKDISERKRAEADRAALHEKLMVASRQAGMAEVATDVLHNVGNVLNSITVSVSVVTDRVRTSELSNLERAAELIAQHGADLGDFITRDERGRHLPQFLIEVARCLGEEQRGVLSELDSLKRGIEHVQTVVQMQQGCAKHQSVVEHVAPADLVEAALRMQQESLSRHGVTVKLDLAALPKVWLDKHRIIQVFVNLIRNARQAVAQLDAADRVITITTASQSIGERPGVAFTVTDSGVGIPAENLDRIFAHGFTTRKDGHGFGLHGSANAATEMGGTLTATSGGPRKGAAFVLTVPLGSTPATETGTAAPAALPPAVDDG